MKKQVARGRKLVLSARQRRDIIRLSIDQKLSTRQLAQRYRVSHMAIYRVIKRGLGTATEQGDCQGPPITQQQAADQGKRPRIYSSYG